MSLLSLFCLSETVRLDTFGLFLRQPFFVSGYPPRMGLVLPYEISLLIHLIPWLWSQYIVNIFDFVISPYLIMHAFPPERLQRVINIWQWLPTSSEEIGKQRLICKLQIKSLVRRHVVDDEIINLLGWIHNLKSTIHVSKRSHIWIWTSRLCDVGSIMLTREGAILRNPYRDISLNSAPVNESIKKKKKKDTHQFLG